MDQQVEKWIRWVGGPVRDGVVTLFFNRMIYRGIGEIIRENGSLPDSIFWNYHRNLYGATQGIAIRRQADLHPDTASLAKLISEIESNARKLTLEWWIGLWHDPTDAAYATRQWNQRYAGSVGDHLDPAFAAADHAHLKADAAKVKLWVDKHIAHADQTPIAAEASVTSTRFTIRSTRSGGRSSATSPC